MPMLHLDDYVPMNKYPKWQGTYCRFFDPLTVGNLELNVTMSGESEVECSVDPQALI